MLGLACAVAVGPATAAAAIFPGEPIDGPSPGLRSVGGLDVALDGTGAVVYVKRVDGADHVVASRLVGGAWGAPEGLDGGLPGGSASPAVAVSPGGAVRVAFVNGGSLYTVTRVAATAPWTGPTLTYTGGPVGPPSLSTSVHGKSYLAFAAPGAGGSDVHVAFARGAGGWTLAGPPLDADPARSAGAGTGRPKVSTSADGIAVVAWGEAGEIRVRRVWGAAPSIVAPIASLPGPAESPEVATLNDSSYAMVTWRQPVGPVQRAFARRLRGSRFEGELAVDGQGSPGAEDAAPPRVVASGSGRGMVITTRNGSDDVVGTILGSRVSLQPPGRIDAAPDGGSADPTVAASSGAAMLAAWEEAGGTQPEIVGRPYGDGTFGDQVGLSTADLGPTSAADGLEAAADGYGDIAVAFLQGAPSARRLVVASSDQPPGRFGAVPGSGAFTRSRRPVIGWSPSRDQWGGAVYTVLVGGQAVATTRRTEFRLPGPLPDGRYAWQVVATDRRGQERAGGGSAVRIDGTPPTAELVGLAATTRLAVGVRFRVDALDEPPLAATPPGAGGGAGGASRARSRVRTRRAPRGVNAAQASGLVGIRVEYGDGSVVRVASRAGAPSLTSRLRHRYLRTGRFRLRVVTRDVAGNSSVVERIVRVVKPKPKPKKKRKPARKARRAAR